MALVTYLTKPRYIRYNNSYNFYIMLPPFFDKTKLQKRTFRLTQFNHEMNGIVVCFK